MGQTLETVADSWARSPGGSSMRRVWRTPPFLGVWLSAGAPSPTSRATRARASASHRGRGMIMGSYGEPAPEHAPDEIRVGAELVELAGVAGAKGGPLGVAECVPGH